LSESGKTDNIEKLWNANYIHLLCMSAITSIAFQMVNPVLSRYVVSLGESVSLGGVIVGLLALTAMVARPFSGAMADRLNNKRILIVSSAMTALTVICYSFVDSIPLLMLLRIMHGALFAITSTTSVAFASTFIPRNKMGEGIGYLGFGQVFAVAVGPGIGMFVSERFGYYGIFALSSATSVLAAAFMTLIRNKHIRRNERMEKFRFRFADYLEVRLLPLAILGGLFAFCTGMNSAFMALLGDERGISNIGLYFTVNAVALLIIRPLSGKLNDKKGVAAIMLPAYIIAAAGMSLLGVSSAIWMILLAAVFIAIGQGSGQPALQTECIRQLQEKRGVATSTYYVGLDIGQGLGAIAGGAVLDSYGFGTMYAGTGALLILGLLGFVFYRKFGNQMSSNAGDW